MQRYRFNGGRKVSICIPFKHLAMNNLKIISVYQNVWVLRAFVSCQQTHYHGKENHLQLYELKLTSMYCKSFRGFV